ncbi:MAG: aminotransferase class V-fold PLP-dependent enzyme [Acidimicrobiales bacterium]
MSWVQFARGWRTDLAALARCATTTGRCSWPTSSRASACCRPSSTWGVDVAAADAHKWLLGPLGCGVAYLSHRAQEVVRPSQAGWASVSHREDWGNLDLVYDDTARRYEGGSLDAVAIAGMGASMQLLLDATVDRAQHVDALNDRLCAGAADLGLNVLSDRSPAGRSGHVTLGTPGADPTEVCERLEADGVVCSPRGGGVRVAPHGYTTAEEIDRALEALAAATSPDG